MNISDKGPMGVIQCAYRLNYRPCLQEGKATLVLGLPQHSHISSFLTRLLGLPQQEGYPTYCLVNALLGITRAPTRDSFPPSCATPNIFLINLLIHLDNIRYFLYMMIVFSRFFFANLTCFPQTSFRSNLGHHNEYFRASTDETLSYRQLSFIDKKKSSIANYVRCNRSTHWNILVVDKKKMSAKNLETKTPCACW